MGATEEQMRLLSDANVTHVSYILILYSVAFLLYLLVNILLYVYASHAWPDDETNGMRVTRNRPLSSAGPSHSRKVSVLHGMNGGAPGPANGSVRLPRHRGTDSQQVRDAEEFELEGLISEGEEDGSATPLKKVDAV